MVDFRDHLEGLPVFPPNNSCALATFIGISFPVLGLDSGGARFVLVIEIGSFCTFGFKPGSLAPLLGEAGGLAPELG